MQITTKERFTNWKEFTLANNRGMQVSFLNYGGIITEILVPDTNGAFENVVLGFEDYQDYAVNPAYFGAIIGRVAGRIKGGSFTLDGKHYDLEKNDGTHHLHGGANGLHQVVWDAIPFEEESAIGVKLIHTLKDGADGYPGEVHIKVTYRLNNDNQFSITYDAISNQDTPLSLTNHSYFNLTGNMKETIADHSLQLDSKKFLGIDEELIPTGDFPDVAGTAFDFRLPRLLKDGMEGSHLQNILAGNGYDHYFLFDSKKQPPIYLQEPASGRTLSITTNQPGVVLYTGNGLTKEATLRGNVPAAPHSGVCFETQGPPASLHDASLPSIIEKKYVPYQKETTFTFGTIKR